MPGKIRQRVHGSDDLCFYLHFTWPYDVRWAGVILPPVNWSPLV